MFTSSIGKKIGSGFALLLLLACLAGYLSSAEMRRAADDSRRVAAEYIPKVKFALNLGWSLNDALTRINEAPGSEQAGQEALQALEKVRADFEKMREHSIKYPSHVPLVNSCAISRRRLKLWQHPPGKLSKPGNTRAPS